MFSLQHAPRPTLFGSPRSVPSPHPQTSTPVRVVRPGMHPPGVQMDVQQLFSLVQQSGGSVGSLMSLFTTCCCLSVHLFVYHPLHTYTHTHTHTPLCLCHLSLSLYFPVFYFHKFHACQHPHNFIFFKRHWSLAAQNWLS